MINRTQWRSYMLAITSISINLAVVYTFFSSTVGNRPVTEFKFPATVANFQAIANSPQIPPNPSATEIIQARQKYHYSQDGQAIDLDITYLVGTRGDVGTFLENYTQIPPSAIKSKSIKQLPEIGSHALLTDQNQVYLTSCISPRSLSNVTQKQFSQYRYQNDLRWQIGLNWLQGKASIRDRRCLWILLSLPITPDNPQADYLALETAWKDIYRWCLGNFPPLTK